MNGGFTVPYFNSINKYPCTVPPCMTVVDRMFGKPVLCTAGSGVAGDGVCWTLVSGVLFSGGGRESKRFPW